jgi:hypothetical protein
MAISHGFRETGTCWRHGRNQTPTWGSLAPGEVLESNPHNQEVSR